MKCAAIIVTTEYDDKYNRCRESVIQSFKIGSGIFEDIIFIDISYKEGEENINTLLNQAANLAFENKADWIFLLRSDQLAVPGVFESNSTYLKTYDAVWGQEYNYLLNSDNELIAEKKEGQIEKTENFKDILFFPDTCMLNLGYFVRTQTALMAPFKEEDPEHLDIKTFFSLWKKFKCIKIQEPMVCEPQLKGAGSDGLFSPDIMKAQYSKALEEFKNQEINDIYFSGKPFKKNMDIVLYGIMRSGTTLISDLLSIKNESIIFHEPDILQTIYQQDFAENNEYNKILKVLKESGLDTGLLPIWNKNDYPTFVQYFDAILYPFLSDFNIKGAKIIDFNDWKGFLAAFRPEKILLTVRDIRDVVLSAIDLALTINNLVVDEYWIEIKVLESCRQLIAMSKLPCMAVRYEDLCTNPDVPRKIASFFQMQSLGTERINIDRLMTFRKYEIEKHGRAVSSKSVNRHEKEPFGFVLSLAETIWRRCPEYSENFQYKAPDPPCKGELSLGLSRRNARKAALDYIKEGDIIMDLSCGTMSLEPMLPKNCEYIPCDTITRGKRKDIQICNPNENIYPDFRQGSRIVALNLLEYVKDPSGFLKRIREAGIPLICSYHPPEHIELDRRIEIGWRNHMTFEKLIALAKDMGLSVENHSEADNLIVMELLPA